MFAFLSKEEDRMANRSNRIHPAVYESLKDLEEGRISRREFLRLATLLGVSAPFAYAMAACTPATPEATAPPEPTTAPESTTPPEPTTGPPTAAPEEPTSVPSEITRGGVLREGMGIQAVDHPARFSWTQAGNVFRHAFGYLAQTGHDNVTRPYLLKDWEVSDDLTEWTLHINEGMIWTNGDEFNAEDVVFNLNEWLNPDVGSSMLGFFDGFLTPENIEVVDDYTVVLHLDKPKLDVPENFSLYPALIVHRNFGGDITSPNEPSLMYMVLDEYIVGERARLVAREDYWEMGADGQPLPYLDAIEYIDLGEDQTSHVAALLNGDIGSIYEPSPETFLSVKDNENVRVVPIATAETRVLRMRSDIPPWDDNNLRLALKKCQQRQQILDQAYFGEGVLGHDTHVSPIHPAYYEYPIPEYDPEGAKALLEESGHADGIDVSIAVGTGWSDIVAYAETLAESCKEGNIRLTLDTMPTSAYWDIWTETELGLTSWGHRPLGTMVLSLAYTKDSDGNPVPWNETHWIDDEFSDLLNEALGVLDVEERREIMKELERIQMERGSVGIAYWMNMWGVFNPAFKNIMPHPQRSELWKEVWYNPEDDPFA
jgi:peptide/nickel transport system substrate-binding protein